MEFQSAFPLGKKGVLPSTKLDMLGQIGRHLDCDYSSSERVKPVLSGMKIEAMAVRATVIVSPGDCVDWAVDATYGPGRATADDAGAGVGAGIVDPFLTEDVAVGEVYWLIRFGPTLVKFTTGATRAPGDAMQASGTAGRVVVLSTGLQIGRMLVDVDTAVASDTLVRMFADFRF